MRDKIVPVFIAILVAGWLGVCGIWFGLLIAQVRAKRRGLLLAARHLPAAEAESTGSQTVSLVIPARNEGSRIASCLASVRAQDYPALEVVVVDDRSDDDTGAVAQRIAEADQRVRVLRIDFLPRGWLGKSHALWRATRTVASDWILFLDADCALEPSAIRVAVAEARRRNAGLLTLWPRIQAAGFWEHLLIPLCAGVVALWYGSDRVNTPNSKLAFANGQFLLVRRDEYERIGGHRSVHRAVIEDIPLAERAKRAGVRCHVASGRDLFCVRMYTGYVDIRDGWARIYVGALRSSLKITVSLAWLALGSLLPFIAAVVLVLPTPSHFLAAEFGQVGVAALRLCCGLHLALVLLVSFRFWGLGACRRCYLFLYPLSVILVARILCRSWWWLSIRRSISWSSTQYRIDGEGVIVD